MIHALLEFLFVTFPMTTIAAIAGAVAGGYFFGPVGAVLGGVIGLICGMLLEFRLQVVLSASARARWAGIVLVICLIVTVGMVAIFTR
ncbi:MAG: hypothetical protein ACR2PI_26290 [Hyphomicrobiaceae bacterium]